MSESVSVRDKIAEITNGCTCQVDMDSLVSRMGGLPMIYETHFAGADKMEFLMEWDDRKTQFRGRQTHYDD